MGTRGICRGGTAQFGLAIGAITVAQHVGIQCCHVVPTFLHGRTGSFTSPGTTHLFPAGNVETSLEGKSG